MTQAQVSHEITSASHYSNIERQRYEPSKGILELLAGRLSIPADYLTSGYIDDNEMEELLKQYEDLLQWELLSDARCFRATHTIKFDYIPSLTQEFHFKLLRCLEYFKAREFKNFKKCYLEGILPFVGNSLNTLNPSVQESFDYMSGLFHYINDNYEESIIFYSNVLEVNKDVLLQARLNFNIALANFRLQRYKEALYYTMKSRDLHLNSHNWKKSAECYNLLAVLYKSTNDFANAESSIHKGLKILNDDSEETHSKLLHTYALLYKEQGQQSEALIILDKCIYLKKKHNSFDLFISYQAKLNILLEKKDKYSILLNIELARYTCKSKLHEIHLQVIEGKLFLLQNHHFDYENSLQYCIDYYLENEIWEYLKIVTKEFADYYAGKKHYKKAYDLIKICLLANEKIHQGG